MNNFAHLDGLYSRGSRKVCYYTWSQIPEGGFHIEKVPKNPFIWGSSMATSPLTDLILAIKEYSFFVN